MKVGQRFERLTVVALLPDGRCRCRCDCGVLKELRSRSVRSGHAKSCGCLHRQLSAAVCRTRNTTHGATGTPEHEVWRHMLRRCYAKTDAAYKDYGGRGIKVCARWRRSFVTFLADVGPRPSTQHQLDRYPDNDSDYKPGNIRWATPTEQARNRRSTYLIKIGAETLCAKDWAFRNGLKPTTVCKRLRAGWDPVRAVTEKV